MNDPQRTDLTGLTEDFRNTVIDWITDKVKQRRGYRYGFVTAIPVPPVDDGIVAEVAESVWFDDAADKLMIVTRDLKENSHKSYPASFFSADLLISISDKFKRNE